MSSADDFTAAAGHGEDILNGVPCFQVPYIIEHKKVSAEQTRKNVFPIDQKGEKNKPTQLLKWNYRLDPRLFIYFYLHVYIFTYIYVYIIMM